MPRDYFGEGVQAGFNMFREAIAMAVIMTAATEVIKQIWGPQEDYVFAAVMGIALIFDTVDNMRQMKYWPTQRLIGSIAAWILLLILMSRTLGSLVGQDLAAEFTIYLIYALLIIALRLTK